VSLTLSLTPQVIYVFGTQDDLRVIAVPLLALYAAGRICAEYVYIVRLSALVLEFALYVLYLFVRLPRSSAHLFRSM